MEMLSHVLGTCGEFHPNLFTVVGGILLTFILFKNVKSYKKQ